MKKRTLTPGNLFVALAGFLFLACFSVVLVLNLRCIYYFDIGYLDLVNETGYSEETIRSNYDALIDYNLILSDTDELEFPDFPMSENAATHFREVKQIFVAVQYLCIIAGILFLIGLCIKLFRKEYRCLLLLCILTFVIPIVLGVCAAVNWDAFFVGFHELFFNNDYWLFDPVTDPVILILPDTFFAHCAAAILLFLLLGGILTGVLYRLLTGRERRLQQESGPSMRQRAGNDRTKGKNDKTENINNKATGKNGKKSRQRKKEKQKSKIKEEKKNKA